MPSRYRYKKLHAAGDAVRRYGVTRRTDGQELGTIRRVRHGSAVSFEIECANEDFNGRGFRTMEEAADGLDVASLADRLCACGRSVPQHDRPTRIAMRAYANSTAAQWTNRHAEAAAAFQQAMPRDGAYSNWAPADAGYHAHEFAVPHQGGSVKLVQTLHGDRLSVDVHLGHSDGSVAVLHWLNGNLSAVEQVGHDLADPAATVAEQVAAFQAQGYALAYDWRS